MQKRRNRWIRTDDIERRDGQSAQVGTASWGGVLLESCLQSTLISLISVQSRQGLTTAQIDSLSPTNESSLVSEKTELVLS